MFPLALSGLPELWYKELDPKSLTKYYQHRYYTTVPTSHSSRPQFLGTFQESPALSAAGRVQRGFPGRGAWPLSCPVGSLSPGSLENRLKRGNFYQHFFFSVICFLNTTQFKGHASAAGTRRCFKHCMCLTEITKTIILSPQLQRWFLKGNYIAPWEVN